MAKSVPAWSSFFPALEGMSPVYFPYVVSAGTHKHSSSRVRQAQPAAGSASGKSDWCSPTFTPERGIPSIFFRDAFLLPVFSWNHLSRTPPLLIGMILEVFPARLTSFMPPYHWPVAMRRSQVLTGGKHSSGSMKGSRDANSIISCC